MSDSCSVHLCSEFIGFLLAHHVERGRRSLCIIGCVISFYYRSKEVCEWTIIDSNILHTVGCTEAIASQYIPSSSGNLDILVNIIITYSFDIAVEIFAKFILMISIVTRPTCGGNIVVIFIHLFVSEKEFAFQIILFVTTWYPFFSIIVVDSESRSFDEIGCINQSLHVGRSYLEKLVVFSHGDNFP